MFWSWLARHRPSPELPGASRGHSDHWGCILRDSEEGSLFEMTKQAMVSQGAPIAFRTGAGSKRGAAYRSSGGPVKGCVLADGSRVVSAYPEVEGGQVWDILIKQIVPWASGIEGQLVGECHGERVAFFDTRFYANQGRYSQGGTYPFHMNAFAYILGKAADKEYETDMGAKVSIKGAHAFMPARAGNESADIDDYWFHSPLEGQPRDAPFEGRMLWACPVIVAIPDNHELHLDVYAAPHTLAAGMESVQPGDDLEGYIWLQGYLAEPSGK